MLTHYTSVDLLVLDEVGVQFDSDSEKLIMFDVINGRYNDLKSTIVISNYPITAKGKSPSVASVLGERNMDRLRENGGKLVTFDWESHRKVQS